MRSFFSNIFNITTSTDMTTAPAPVSTPATSTVELNETVARLNTLHAAYDNILQQAKNQLNDIDLQPEHVRNICDALMANDEFRRELERRCVAMLVSRLKDASEDGNTEERTFVGNVTEMVWNKINQPLVESVQDEFKRVAETDYVSNLITERVNAQVNVDPKTEAAVYLELAVEKMLKTMVNVES